VPSDRSNPGAVVELRGVTKRYSNGTVAVSNVDLDLYAGQFTSLLGPSGCGKTTVLRMIAGLAEVTSGRIDWPAQDEASAQAALHDALGRFVHVALRSQTLRVPRRDDRDGRARAEMIVRGGRGVAAAEIREGRDDDVASLCVGEPGNDGDAIAGRTLRR